MQTVICILGYVFAAILLLAALVGIWAYIGHARQLNRLRRQFAKGQTVRYYLGHNQREGRILHVMHAHVKVRDYYDLNEYKISIRKLQLL